MRISKTLTAVAVSLLCAASAFADCTYPKKPSDPPDGSKATKEQMIAAQQATKQFNLDVETYLACLDKETDAMVTALGQDAKPEQIQQVKSKQAMKHNAAVDDLQQHADAFNKQLRAYKSK